MMRILLSAFACAPGLGSEPGNGWNWAVALVDAGHEVTVLTAPSPRTLAEVHERPRLGLTVEPVEVPAWSRRLRGQLAVYTRYLAWQVAAFGRAKALTRSQSFDLAHHLTWGSLHLGSWLWRLPLPFIYGPTGGGQIGPGELRPYYEGRWANEALRTVIVTRMTSLLPTAVLTMRQADLVLVNNAETGKLALTLGAADVAYLSEIGLLSNQVRDDVPRGSTGDGPLRLIWVGRFMPRKGLPLALKAVADVPRSVNVRLKVVGSGPQDAWARKWVAHHRLKDRITFTGQVPLHEVIDHYRASDALLFTSIRDSSGAQLLEAMGQGLPVITLDHQGAAVLVPRSAGYHVRVTSADSTLHSLVGAISRVAGDSDDRQRRARAALAFARTQTWPRKAAEMTEVYERVVGSRATR